MQIQYEDTLHNESIKTLTRKGTRQGSLTMILPQIMISLYFIGAEAIFTSRFYHKMVYETQALHIVTFKTNNPTSCVLLCNENQESHCDGITFNSGTKECSLKRLDFTADRTGTRISIYLLGYDPSSKDI